MRARHIAEALYALSQRTAGSADIPQNFISYLMRHGLIKLLPKVLTEYKRIDDLEKKRHAAHLVVARMSDAEKYKEEASGVGDIIVEEGIIGGYIIETETTYTDASYRGALLRLYRAITR